MNNKAVLIILDGYGLAAPAAGNAIAKAKTPNLDRLFAENPTSKLSASGLDVGLPEGQMGNSEVGHTNIGAGRVVFQILPKMSQEIENGKFFQNPVYIKAMEDAKTNHKPLHILGLMSTGGVHSHLKHVFGILDMARQRGVEQVYVHCFLDGRDVAPKSGAGFIKELKEKCDALGNARIATVQGRFYGMDRDKRWDRVEQGYNAIVCGEGVADPDPVHAIEASYQQDVTDEFVKPVVCCPEGVINQGDSVIFMNFRPDRAREMTWALNLADFDGFQRKKTVYPLSYVCTAQYDEALPLPIAYPPEVIENTLGDYVSAKGLKQFRVAETEKYAHVTFFFNGGTENCYPGEDRCLIPSPKEFPTYDLIPEMSAYKVAAECAARIESGKYDVVICNLANCDMVGHTGVKAAAIRAVETVDACVGQIVGAVKKMGGVILITADHGNADRIMKPDGSPDTAHTTNPVPLIVSGAEVKLRPGRLCDLCPTMLDLMGLPKPAPMTGESLIVK